MLSKDALVEVSMETRQLIITDNASSLATIDELLLSLDAPETPYNVEVFPIQTTQAKEIATLAKQILLPMAGSTPLELIPHPGNHAIYIVSTPFLIDKARQVLKELDIVQPLPEKVERSKVEGSKVEDHVDSVGAPKKQNKFFVYTIKYRTAEQLKTALNHLADYLKKKLWPKRSYGSNNPFHAIGSRF